MKHIACADLGFTCNHVVDAATEDELLQQVAEHAVNVHHIEVTPEVVTKVKSLIKDSGSPDKYPPQTSSGG